VRGGVINTPITTDSAVTSVCSRAETGIAGLRPFNRVLARAAAKLACRNSRPAGCAMRTAIHQANHS
ncbi:MAG: hypothetical protein WBO93_16735, partial [Gammaproteobacteria bacterium]